MKKISITLGLVFVLALPFGANAFTKGACKPDAKKFCKAEWPDKTKIEACLAQHMTELADACKENMKEMANKKVADQK